MPNVKEQLTYLLANQQRIDADGPQRYAKNFGPAQGQGSFEFDESKHPRDEAGKFASKEAHAASDEANRTNTPESHQKAANAHAAAARHHEYNSPKHIEHSEKSWEHKQKAERPDIEKETGDWYDDVIKSADKAGAEIGILRGPGNSVSGIVLESLRTHRTPEGEQHVSGSSGDLSKLAKQLANKHGLKMQISNEGRKIKLTKQATTPDAPAEGGKKTFEPEPGKSSHEQRFAPKKSEALPPPRNPQEATSREFANMSKGERKAIWDKIQKEKQAKSAAAPDSAASAEPKKKSPLDKLKTSDDDELGALPLNRYGGVENSFHKVTKPFKVQAISGHEPSGAYFGNSQVLQAKHKELTLQPGDEIHSLPGGLFAVTQDGKAHEITYKASDKSPFEKNYGNPNKRIMPLNKLEAIPQGKEKNVKYR